MNKIKLASDDKIDNLDISLVNTMKIHVLSKSKALISALFVFDCQHPPSSLSPIPLLAVDQVTELFVVKLLVTVQVIFRVSSVNLDKRGNQSHQLCS